MAKLGQQLQVMVKALLEGRGFFRVRTEIGIHLVNAGGIEPGAGIARAQQAAYQQSGGHEQEHGCGHLPGYQKAAEAGPAQARTEGRAFLFECSGEVGPGELKGGRQSEDHSRHQRQKQGVSEDAEIGRERNSHGGGGSAQNRLLDFEP